MAIEARELEEKLERERIEREKLNQEKSALSHRRKEAEIALLAEKDEV